MTRCVRQTGDDGWNSHKDGHHNKSSLRQATRLSRALATSQTASPLFSVSSFSVACSRPHSVSSSYGFCSLRAVLNTHRGGGGGEKKKRSRNKRQKLAPCGRGCSVQPVMMMMMSGKKCKAADGSAHARRVLYLQVLIAGGEQMNTLYQNAHHSHLVGDILVFHLIVNSVARLDFLFFYFFRTVESVWGHQECNELRNISWIMAVQSPHQ